MSVVALVAQTCALAPLTRRCAAAPLCAAPRRAAQSQTMVRLAGCVPRYVCVRAYKLRAQRLSANAAAPTAAVRRRGSCSTPHSRWASRKCASASPRRGCAVDAAPLRRTAALVSNGPGRNGCACVRDRKTARARACERACLCEHVCVCVRVLLLFFRRSAGARTALQRGITQRHCVASLRCDAV